MHTQEEMETINKRYEKRETKREAKALIAAKVELAIEKELLNRLQQGTYKGIYNLDATEFNKELDIEEEKEEEQGQTFAAAEEYDSEEDDDSVIGGDLDSDDEEEGEDEIEEELSDRELAQLAKQEQDDANDIENQDGGPNSMPDKKSIKKNGKVLGKRKRPISLEYEEERETERVPQKRRVTN